jgi:hypothetical protein
MRPQGSLILLYTCLHATHTVLHSSLILLYPCLHATIRVSSYCLILYTCLHATICVSCVLILRELRATEWLDLSMRKSRSRLYCCNVCPHTRLRELRATQWLDLLMRARLANATMLFTAEAELRRYINRYKIHIYTYAYIYVYVHNILCIYRYIHIHIHIHIHMHIHVDANIIFCASSITAESEVRRCKVCPLLCPMYCCLVSHHLDHTTLAYSPPPPFSQIHAHTTHTYRKHEAPPKRMEKIVLSKQAASETTTVHNILYMGQYVDTL